MADRRVLLYNGEIFEYGILDVVQAAFPDAVMMHDVRVFSQYLGKETQIDLIVITSGGVFVLEAKNWKFWVSGDYGDFMWTGKSRENRMLTVFNPIHQNFIHIRSLRNCIRCKNMEPVEFHNLIVVPDGTEIKSPCREVITLSMLSRRMRDLFVQNSVDVAECQLQIESVRSNVWNKN